MLKELRTARGLSQPLLARMAGTSQPTICRIETGGTASARLIDAIARALDLDADEYTALTASVAENARERERRRAQKRSRTA